MFEPTEYTPEWIASCVEAYACHHEVELADVLVDRRCDDEGRVIGIRLSLDVDGRSRGCDETFGQWR